MTKTDGQSRTSRRQSTKVAARKAAQGVNVPALLARVQRQFSYVEGVPVRNKVAVLDAERPGYMPRHMVLDEIAQLVPSSGIKTCYYCHREGTRGFTTSQDNHTICANTAACDKRINAAK